MSQLLGARNLRRDFLLGRGGEVVHAVRGVSLDVAEGDYLAIVGPSGSGKSSLLNLLGAIDRPSGGHLSIAGRRIDAMRDRELTNFRLRNIGFVFQRFYLVPVLTARENVELPMAEAGIRKAERRARA